MTRRQRWSARRSFLSPESPTRSPAPCSSRTGRTTASCRWRRRTGCTPRSRQRKRRSRSLRPRRVGRSIARSTTGRWGSPILRTGLRPTSDRDDMKRELLFLVSLVFGTGAFAQYPAKPIRLVVPFPAGESVDATARLVGQSWSAALGQQILVDNRGGAGGTIGSEAVAKSAPDGYTLLWGNVGPLAIGPSLYKKLGYDVAKDFEPVSLVATLPFVLFASPALPANSVVELLAYARAHPGQLNFCSTGAGWGLARRGRARRHASRNRFPAEPDSGGHDRRARDAQYSRGPGRSARRKHSGGLEDLHA